MALASEFYLVMLTLANRDRTRQTCCTLAGAGEEVADLQNIPSKDFTTLKHRPGYFPGCEGSVPPL